MTSSLSSPPAHRDMATAIKRGFRCRCPNCGEGKMFASYLKATHACTACGQELDQHRADDLPAYVVVFIVGHIVVGLNLMVERAAEWPLWLHFALWPTLALLLTMLMLQPVKGALIAYQWALRLHGFDPAGDPHDVSERFAPREPAEGHAR